MPHSSHVSRAETFQGQHLPLPYMGPLHFRPASFLVTEPPSSPLPPGSWKGGVVWPGLLTPTDSSSPNPIVGWTPSSCHHVQVAPCYQSWLPHALKWLQCSRHSYSSHPPLVPIPHQVVVVLLEEDPWASRKVLSSIKDKIQAENNTSRMAHITSLQLTVRDYQGSAAQSWSTAVFSLPEWVQLCSQCCDGHTSPQCQSIYVD